MAKVETLVDAFTTQQPWWGSWGNTAWVDGRLRIEVSSAFDGASSWPVPRFDFTESAAFIECEPAPPAETRQALFSLRESANNFVVIGVENVNLLCRVVTNGAFDSINQPYDPVAMRFLRLRHTGSTIYWETAPEGSGPWTIRRQVPQPSWSITAVEVHMTAGNWGGLPGGVFAYFDNLNVRKIETLVDDFAIQQPWWQVQDSDNVAWLGGRLRITTTSGYPWVVSNPPGGFDLTDSAAFVEAEPNPPEYTRQIFFRVGPNMTVDDLAITVRDAPWDLECRVTTGGVQDNSPRQPYDPVTMRFLRIRHAGSTVFWETAPAASGPWTIRRQAPQPSWPLTAVQVRLEAGNWGGLPGAGSFAWFDNLNYLAPAPPTGRIETFTAGKQWGTAYAQGHAVESLWKAGVQVYERPPYPPLTNLLTNGSFETNTTGWTGSLTLSRQALGVPHGEFGSWRGQNSGTVNGAHWLQRSAALPVVNGRRYYLRGRVATATATMGNVVQFLNTTTVLAGVPTLTLTPVNTWLLYDAIWTANISALTLRANYTGGSGNNTRTGWLDNVMVLDLTDAFGAGDEPDIDTIREIVADGGGYWDGTWDPALRTGRV